MSITKAQYDALKDFFEDLFSANVDAEHVMLHVDIKVVDRHLTFTHDKLNCQDAQWLKEASADR